MQTRDPRAAELRAGRRAGPQRLDVFDITFGLLLPLFCMLVMTVLLRDAPPTARSDPDSDRPYPAVWAAAWVFVLQGCALLVVYAWRGPRSRTECALVGGALLACALAWLGLGLGLFLAPLAHLGFFPLALALAPYPLGTSWAFFRWALRALGPGGAWRRGSPLLFALMGMLLALGLPAATWAAGRKATPVASRGIGSDRSDAAQHAGAAASPGRLESTSTGCSRAALAACPPPSAPQSTNTRHAIAARLSAMASSSRSMGPESSGLSRARGRPGRAPRRRRPWNNRRRGCWPGRAPSGPSPRRRRTGPCPGGTST